MLQALTAATSKHPASSPVCCPRCRWAVLTSPSGALAGRFTDIAVEDELQPTDDVFFLADLQGNDSVDPFTFNVTQDITWPPSLPRNASTQFTLSVVDTEDGNFLYNIFLTGGPAAWWGAEFVDPLWLHCATVR